MNWTTFAKMIVKIVTILNIIRKTAEEQNISLEYIFSALDEKNSRKALKVSAEMFANEIRRLNDGPEYEVCMSPAPMTTGTAINWVNSMHDEGWRFITTTDFDRNLHKALSMFNGLSDGKRYWEERTDIRREAGHRYFGACSTSYAGIEIGACCDRNDIYAVFVRELPPKTWQLI
jgi:hypothetical protein